MATLSVTVDDAFVDQLVPALKADLAALGVDTTGLTNAQLGRRWIRQRMLLTYETFKASETQDSQAGQMATARNEAKAAAGTAIT